MIFYRYPIIYQHITLTPEEPAVVLDVEDSIVDDVAMVVRPDVFYSSIVDVEDIELEEPGWDQAPPPPLVPVRKVAPSSIVVDLREDSVEFPIVDDTPIVLRPDVFYSETVKAEQIELEEPGWEQAFNPPLILPRKIPDSSTIIVQEVAVVVVEESGWNQAYNPPLVPVRVIPASVSIIGDEVALIGSGWEQAFNPPIVPARIIPPSSLAFVDEVAEIGSGWEQAYNPPLVPARKIPPGTVIIVLDVAEIGSGWDQAFSPPLVLPRKIPPSTTTLDEFDIVVVEGPGWDQAFSPPLVAARIIPDSTTTAVEFDVAIPGVGVVRLRILGGGFLRRKELG